VIEENQKNCVRITCRQVEIQIISSERIVILHVDMEVQRDEISHKMQIMAVFWLRSLKQVQVHI
jgi:hypothetical protein